MQNFTAACLIEQQHEYSIENIKEGVNCWLNKQDVFAEKRTLTDQNKQNCFLVMMIKIIQMKKYC